MWKILVIFLVPLVHWAPKSTALQSEEIELTYCTANNGQCFENSECCSGNCDQLEGFEFGICRPFFQDETVTELKRVKRAKKPRRFNFRKQKRTADAKPRYNKKRAKEQYTKEMNKSNPKLHTADDAGHATGRNLGGRGDVKDNVIPQNRKINRDHGREMDKVIAKDVRKHGEVVKTQRFVYDDNNASRPNKIQFKVEEPNGKPIRYGTIENPFMAKANSVAKKMPKKSDKGLAAPEA